MRVERVWAWVWASLALGATSAWADGTVVILRHGEKPPAGLGQLSCQGLNRALALPRVLIGRFGPPTGVYAPNPAVQKQDRGVLYAYVRPLATVEPLAIAVGLPVNLQWGMTETPALAQHLLAQPSGSTLVVAWEHHWAATLARDVLRQAGADPSAVPAWEDGDFDSLYVLRWTEPPGQPRQWTFQHDRQDLNGQPGACPQR